MITSNMMNTSDSISHTSYTDFPFRNVFISPFPISYIFLARSTMIAIGSLLFCFVVISHKCLTLLETEIVILKL